MTQTKLAFNQTNGNVVSVLDYGADPTGVSDSISAITNALSASKKVYFPKGTYTVSSPVVLSGSSPYHIFGDGNESIIKKNSSFDGIQVSAGRSIIENLQVQGFTPELVVGGSSSGITYFSGRQKGTSRVVGADTEVKIHLRVTGLGGNTGVIHITGLPETIFDEGNAWAIAGTGWIDSIGVIGVRYIASNNELRIYQISGAQFDDTTFPLNQEINISINYRRVV